MFSDVVTLFSIGFYITVRGEIIIIKQFLECLQSMSSFQTKHPLWSSLMCHIYHEKSIRICPHLNLYLVNIFKKSEKNVLSYCNFKEIICKLKKYPCVKSYRMVHSKIYFIKINIFSAPSFVKNTRAPWYQQNISGRGMFRGIDDGV